MSLTAHFKVQVGLGLAQDISLPADALEDADGTIPSSFIWHAHVENVCSNQEQRMHVLIDSNSLKLEADRRGEPQSQRALQNPIVWLHRAPTPSVRAILISLCPQYLKPQLFCHAQVYNRLHCSSVHNSSGEHSLD